MEPLHNYQEYFIAKSLVAKYGMEYGYQSKHYTELKARVVLFEEDHKIITSSLTQDDIDQSISGLPKSVQGSVSKEIDDYLKAKKKLSSHAKKILNLP